MAFDDGKVRSLRKFMLAALGVSLDLNLAIPLYFANEARSLDNWSPEKARLKEFSTLAFSCWETVCKEPYWDNLSCGRA